MTREGAPMLAEGTRIALVHPTYWPEVRRGSERVIHDLAGYLSGRGYRPTILTSHPHRPRSREEGGVEVVRAWRPPDRLVPRGLEPFAAHAPMAAIGVARRRFELVHAFHIADAWAISPWCRAMRRPMVLSLMGLPDAEALDGYRGRRRMLRGAMRGASAVHALSGYALSVAPPMVANRAIAIHPGTHTSNFAVAEPAAEPPLIFCAASGGDPRKRVALLLDAFRLLSARRPDVRLAITAPAPVGAAVDRERVEIVPTGIPQEELAGLYARSRLTVLPSEREAFGQVLVESMAAGTPVVTMAGGAAEEIVRPGVTGLLCDRADADALADSLEEGLRLSESPGVRESCRRHAAGWDWARQGPRYEGLYARALEAGPA